LRRGFVASAGHVGNATRGEVTAKRWCAACHLLSPQQTTANADVPSFAGIAQEKKLTAAELTTFLSSSHPRMPDMELTRDEIADIVTYIRSLDQKKM
jgi:mono/diheme cytochrome c family protein